jgi:hypothetical protein
MDLETLTKTRTQKQAEYRQAVGQANAHAEQAARQREMAVRLDAQIALLNEQIGDTPNAAPSVPAPAKAPNGEVKEART